MNNFHNLIVDSFFCDTSRKTSKVFHEEKYINNNIRFVLRRVFHL